MPTATSPPANLIRPSPVRAWCYLVWLSFLRLARARQMVWMALGLLVLAVGGVGMVTARHDWAPRRLLTAFAGANVFASAAAPMALGPVGALGSLLDSGLPRWVAFMRFSGTMFRVLMGFLLPIWSLSFATQALGGDREEGSLLWLVSRPLPRPAVYLAKYVALLPWALALNVGGFTLLCLAAGTPGKQAFPLYWPAVFLATIAYAALFHLMGALFRRPAVVALVYTFFIETFVGSMPGAMKRISVSFFDRCLMISAAQRWGVQPPAAPDIYMPVSGATAAIVLAVGTAALLLAGAFLFSRAQFTDMT